MPIKLKPCPFCGGEAKVFKHKKTMASFGTLFSHEVECAYCFCRTGLYPSEEKAVNAWNRRKAPEIVRCGECVNFAERDFCKVAGHNVHRKSNCMQVFGAEGRTDGSV